MTDDHRCEGMTAGIRCFRSPVVVMSIVTPGSVRAERSLCSRCARRYAQAIEPQLAAGVALLQYDFSRHREVFP